MEKIAQYCENIKNKRSFQYFVTFVILISSLTIGVKTYSINENIYGLLLITDYVITIIFLIEIIIRFLAEKKLKDFFSDGWNVFDLVIVIGSLIPANATESVLVLRLLRLFRLLRIISFIPELKTIVENLAISLRKSVYILLLIFIITYIYAVVGTTYFSEIPGAQFKTLGESMITLVQVGTMSSWENVLAPVSEALPMSWLYFISYIFICGIVILNLFVALLVDVVAAQRIDNEKND